MILYLGLNKNLIVYQNMHPDIPLSDVTAYHKIRALEAEMKRLKQLQGLDKNSYNDRMVSGTDDDYSENDSPDISVKKKHKKKLKTKRKEHKKSEPKYLRSQQIQHLLKMIHLQYKKKNLKKGLKQ